VFVGEAVGENRDEIMAQLDVYSNVVYALIVLGGLAAVWYYVKKIRSREMD
jgi:hypothetical protein